MKILIIEDESILAESILQYLKNEDYLCEWVDNLKQAKEKSWDYEYDCLVIDINLPDGSGLEVIKQVKKMNSDIGIIIVSARNAMDAKIKGLDLGADDYMTKPFDLPELNARIKAIVRRKKFNAQNSITYNEIEVFPYEKYVKVNDMVLKLTRKEYDLMLFFISNPDRVIPKESIAEHLWGDQMDMADSFDFIYSHLKNLRKKIKEKSNKNYILTVYGLGYKLSDQ
ncbi:DNA-binding response OmpR family regulator [Aquimarina sp. MAR_2010_214]|uniref:response regulator transcription factor n=1 Tax=Aquimarina sp. MAR_2010_214 TaxID=1250026 RepID=UPI000C70857B|nr:response regulator transcription factor [Aquimarina sp. MAR_2010_214]PKV52895.1 DNA-binding response OmpR family regulator [Aquimarina sp. MAR_2010_214]